MQVRQPAKVMWWEKLLLWASILERSVLYPLIFISAVTQVNHRIRTSLLFFLPAGLYILENTHTHRGGANEECEKGKRKEKE